MYLSNYTAAPRFTKLSAENFARICTRNRESIFQKIGKYVLKNISAQPLRGNFLSSISYFADLMYYSL